jgi:succinate dehydrogenase / fumarate reductase, cytochrome b subunit
MSATSALINPPSRLASVPLVGWLVSSPGKKTVVALTGIALVLFAVGHMLGNFTIYFGPDAINTYALKLHSLGPLLWVVRLGLLAVVVAHIFFTMLLWAENRRARPRKYAVFAPMTTTVFARTMRLSGLFILAFVVFHLAHFTLQVVDPAYAAMKTQLDGKTVHDVYRMVVVGFSNPWVAGFYVVALFLLALHLSHGIGSLFQTLGITNQRLRPLFTAGGHLIAWGLFIGYASIPVSIALFGLGKEALK